MKILNLTCVTASALIGWLGAVAAFAQSINPPDQLAKAEKACVAKQRVIPGLVMAQIEPDPRPILPCDSQNDGCHKPCTNNISGGSYIDMPNGKDKCTDASSSHCVQVQCTRRVYENPNCTSYNGEINATKKSCP